MEAQQCVKLTGTNRSFDLIALIARMRNILPEKNQFCLPVRPRTNPGRGHPSFAGLVALARRPDPIPSRTRPSNALAPMVLCLKTRESRSPPGPQRTDHRKTLQTRFLFITAVGNRQPQWTQILLLGPPTPRCLPSAAGWSSPVARQAHNLKAAGSNPAPATSLTCSTQSSGDPAGAFCVRMPRRPKDRSQLPARLHAQAARRPASARKPRREECRRRKLALVVPTKLQSDRLWPARNPERRIARN